MGWMTAMSEAQIKAGRFLELSHLVLAFDTQKKAFDDTLQSIRDQPRVVFTLGSKGWKWLTGMVSTLYFFFFEFSCFSFYIHHTPKPVVTLLFPFIVFL